MGRLLLEKVVLYELDLISDASRYLTLGYAVDSRWQILDDTLYMKIPSGNLNANLGK